MDLDPKTKTEKEKLHSHAANDQVKTNSWFEEHHGYEKFQES